MHIIVVDNYDSFTYNLVHALASAGAEVSVFRNDEITRDQIIAKGPDGLVLSPGPGHPGVPRDVGVCAELLANPIDDLPILGVCLGMQSMAHYTGGTVIAAPEIVHGMASAVKLANHTLFDGLPREVAVGRYHSLAVDEASIQEQWESLGSTDGILMAMAHRQRPWFGVQFHPESILTPLGPRMIENFLRMCQP